MKTDITDEELIESCIKDFNETFYLLQKVSDNLIDGFQASYEQDHQAYSLLLATNIAMRCKDLFIQIQNAIDSRHSEIKFSNDILRIKNGH